MKYDVVFSRLKRFKFEKIKKNEFRPNYRLIGRAQWLKIIESKLNLRSHVKKNQNFPILLIERQSIQLSKTGFNLS